MRATTENNDAQRGKRISPRCGIEYVTLLESSSFILPVVVIRAVVFRRQRRWNISLSFSLSSHLSAREFGENQTGIHFSRVSFKAYF
jgi:hypothetical protein